MRFPKRLLLVLVAVVATGIGFTSPSQAVDSPVVVMVVPCNETATTTSGTLTAPAGAVYVATVVGVCTPDAGFDWSIGTPCSAPTVGSIPCLTASNLPGAACWTSTGPATVSTCGPTTSVTPNGCTLTVTVDGYCLTAGTTGQIVHPVNGPFTARYEDGDNTDNFGYFVVVLRLAV